MGICEQNKKKMTCFASLLLIFLAAVSELEYNFQKHVAKNSVHLFQ